MATARCPFPDALGLLRGFLLGFRLRCTNHLGGRLYGRLRGISDNGQRLGAGVLDSLDQLVGGLGRGLDDVPGQLLSIFNNARAGPMSLEGCGVGALVSLVIDVGLEVRGELIGNRVEPIGDCKPVT